MKILMINKFLYPKGGAETYALKLGGHLEQQGHEVQYFGMDDEKRTVGNRMNAYTRNMDFHGGWNLDKVTYAVRTIYSFEARKKIRLVLEDFQPDVCHLNNFTFPLVFFSPVLNFQKNCRCQLVVKIVQMTDIRLKIF